MTLMIGASQPLPCLLAAMGNPRNPHTTSGSPFHFLAAGVERGLFDGALPTSADDRHYRIRRASWTLRQLSKGQRPGGFVVSRPGIAEVWRKVRIADRCRIVNCFQLYPESVVSDQRVARWYFIDQTLSQLLEGYDYGARVSPEQLRAACAVEQRGYRSAEGIIVHSHWAEQSVVDEYGITPDKVYVVLQAANLDSAALDAWVRRTGIPAPPEDRPLRLVFVGREWKRKGLDRLLRGVAEARRNGCPVELGVIGVLPSELPEGLGDIGGVAWHGPIDKARDQQRFIELVGSHDVGCLLSRSEAGSVGVHEYHALGLAVLGTTAGGAPEQALAEASVLVPPTASPEEIAKSIIMLEDDRNLVYLMKRYSWENRHRVLWPDRVERILNFFPSRGDAPNSRRTGFRLSSSK